MGAAHLRAAHAVLKCVYLLQTRSKRVLKRMAAKCARMTEATAAAVESVNLVLRLTTQAAKVRAAKVRAARAAVSKVYSLLLLLLLDRIVWDLTPTEICELTAAVAQLVGKKLVSTAQVADCLLRGACTNGACCFEEGAPIAGAELDDVAKHCCRTCVNGRGNGGGGRMGRADAKANDAGGRTSRGEATSGADGCFSGAGIEVTWLGRAACTVCSSRENA